MDTDLEKRCRDYAAHVAALSGLPCSVLDTVRQAFLEPASGRFCESCGFPRCQALNTHLYGSSEAYRWNGEYIYYCPAGLVFAAASVSDEYGEPTGSLVAGPALMENTEDLLTELPDGLRERAASSTSRKSCSAPSTTPGRSS